MESLFPETVHSTSKRRLAWDVRFSCFEAMSNKFRIMQEWHLTPWCVLLGGDCWVYQNLTAGCAGHVG